MIETERDAHPGVLILDSPPATLVLFGAWPEKT